MGRKLPLLARLIFILGLYCSLEVLCSVKAERTSCLRSTVFISSFFFIWSLISSRGFLKQFLMLKIKEHFVIKSYKMITSFCLKAKYFVPADSNCQKSLFLQQMQQSWQWIYFSAATLNSPS